MAAKNRHKIGFWDDSYVQYSFTRLNEAERIDSVPLSDDTVNNRIADIANDILSQLIAQIQDSPCRISLQFDETTDIKSISQLVAYVRFV